MRPILLLTALMLSLLADAQSLMLVHLKSGEVIQYEKSNINSIVFWPRVVEEADPYEGKYGDYEFIDLGLPSGLKWATCNIGASSPEEYGNFYGWGETEPHEDWGNNKYVEIQEFGGFNKFTFLKYNGDEVFGVVDNKMVLDPEDDAAHVVWGEPWRMPTHEDIEELVAYCQLTETVIEGIPGTEFKGPSGKTIFMPNAYNYCTSSLSDPILCENIIIENDELVITEGMMPLCVYILNPGNEPHVDTGDRLGAYLIRPVAE